MGIYCANKIRDYTYIMYVYPYTYVHTKDVIVNTL